MELTAEQLFAIERRDGDLLLDAGAGSGKTAVLVERFARAVVEDGVDVSQILAITFTEKAAAELRERIRGRLRQLGDQDSARAAEGAWISTIHAFGARVLRTHALAAGLDPEFTVLEEHRAAELSGAAFEAALAAHAASPDGAGLLLAYGPGPLRAAVLAAYGQLRAIGQISPALPAPLGELEIGMWDGLEALLASYGERYAALKRSASALDFEDLELLARDLLRREEIGDRYRARFRHVMVDELQDTNRVQLELVDLVAGGGALFMVGDAQQSIYGFRNADVELFQERGRELEARGARASLTVNFRSRPEILSVVNESFEQLMGERFRPLVAAREPASEPPEPRVDLLVVDKGSDWEEDDSLARPWRLAEARVLAGRLAELIEVEGCAAGEIVLLTRATTDLRVYERALEAAGVATYVIGGRGYWGHPQVVQVVAYLRALANPLDQEALYATLLSPLGGGLSLDGLVLLAAGAESALAQADRAALGRFRYWFAGERIAAARLGAEELIDRALAASGYELALLSMPDGRRRLANVRKLMRLAREWETEGGSDLAGFVDLLGRLQSGPGRGRESEAPMETEGLDAVRLMTIHRAKGLEFPVVCVADLGRGPTYGRDLVRLSRDGGRLGLMVARPGLARNLRTPTYAELSDLQWAAEQDEERRLFYVAMTRARERLILSGAMKQASSGARSGTPADWIVPVLRDLPGVRYAWISADSEYVDHNNCGQHTQSRTVVPAEPAPVPALAPMPAPAPAPIPVPTLSYSAIHDHARCGYRFYVERILGVPPNPEEPVPGYRPGLGAPTGGASPGGRQRGTEVHQLLQRIDFRRPVIPSAVSRDVADLLEAFARSRIGDRLAAASDVRREQRFAFPFEGTLVTGTFDVLARESPDRLLVVDYKTDRLDGSTSAALAAGEYGIQRLIYAIAALRQAAARVLPVGPPGPASPSPSAAGGVPRQVEVVHLFLEAPGDAASETYVAADLPDLERELAQASADLRAGVFVVAASPGRSLCRGCPAQGGLCSWPPELTRRS